jgi:hypothetical protein
MVSGLCGTSVVRRGALAIASVALTVFSAACLPGATESSSSSQYFKSPPGQVSYLVNPARYYLNAEVTPNTILSSGQVDSVEITPNLPAGLTLDPTTGTLSGTPTALSPLTEYQVRAINGYGVGYARLVLQVGNVAPTPSTET